MPALWIRHAPTVGRGGFGVVETEPLSEVDWAAAAKTLPERFLSCRWVASPLKRARETARLLAVACGRSGEIEIEERLAEQDFGIFNGMSHSAAEKVHPSQYARLWQDPLGYAPPDGESFRDFYARIARWWREIQRPAVFGAAEKKDCLFVSHSGVIRVVCAEEKRLSPAAALRLEIPHLHPFLLNG